MTDLLTGALPPVTLKDMIVSVNREISMREKVYPHWVSINKITQGTADEELRRMRAVLAQLQRLQHAFFPDVDAISDKLCLGLYFGSEEDREGMIKACKQALPNTRAIKIG